jgi:hypothetical protein
MVRLVVVKVVELVGPVIAATGLVVSGATTVHVNVREAVRTPSDTVAVTVETVLVAGVPLMRPVEAATERPFGRPEAL